MALPTGIRIPISFNPVDEMVVGFCFRPLVPARMGRGQTIRCAEA